MGACARQRYARETRSPRALSRTAARASPDERSRPHLGDRRRDRAVHAKRMSVPGVVARRVLTTGPRGPRDAQTARHAEASAAAVRVNATEVTEQRFQHEAT